ncbi:hypothetical protein LOK49_LG13G00027 [Camellia lanceoleosa]|uniref:Uncharacterized protein n=1 Tax=Camellia lanceoleosa TaxID=1840588 RepID=A0ACC0FG46_9ERIC|nr:hypothetical protein LOK49_LG13G00027 [Camellia lanceoleosa]
MSRHCGFCMSLAAGGMACRRVCWASPRAWLAGRGCSSWPPAGAKNPLGPRNFVSPQDRRISDREGQFRREGRDDRSDAGQSRGSWHQGLSAPYIPRPGIKVAGRGFYRPPEIGIVLQLPAAARWLRQRLSRFGGRTASSLVGKRAAGARVASSPDSDLEAFHHNPTRR